VSATAEKLLEQLKALSKSEQQEIVQQLITVSKAASNVGVESSCRKSFPTAKVQGGPITAEHVAEALDE
jgi:hypothetical protein